MTTKEQIERTFKKATKGTTFETGTMPYYNDASTHCYVPMPKANQTMAIHIIQQFDKLAEQNLDFYFCFDDQYDCSNECLNLRAIPGYYFRTEQFAIDQS